MTGADRLVREVFDLSDAMFIEGYLAMPRARSSR